MGGKLGLSPSCSVLVRSCEEEGKRRRKKEKKKKGRKGGKEKYGKFSWRKIKHNLWHWSKNYFCKKKPN
jgi:hypothetical protein